MPPPPPNFLPAAARRNRRHLDPTRHLQSRELWNKVRFHASSTAATATNNNNGNDDINSQTYSRRWLYYKALLQAILYEIQPFRIKPCYHRFLIFLKEEDGLRHVLSTTGHKTKHILDSIQNVCRLIYNLLQQYCNISSLQQHKDIIWKTSVALISLKLYHRTLLYLHELLHAGPILVILTLFTLLYTIGLGDNTGASSGVPSAYSVFNRGMQRILGTVDAEDLARQYAGGAAVAAAMGGGGGGGGGNNNVVHRVNQRHDDNGGGGGVWVHDNNDTNREDEHDDEDQLRNERRRQRRLERLQRRNYQEEDSNDNNNDDDNINIDDDDFDDNIQNDTPIEADDNAAETNNEVGARKSGKKERRRNLELRREMQRQRQAAAANGFGRGNGDDNVAMDHLIGDVDD